MGETRFHEQRRRATEDVSRSKYWACFKKVKQYFRIEQIRVIQTSKTRKNIDGQNVSKNVEVVEIEERIISKYLKLAQKEYKKQRHNQVVNYA